MALDENGNGDQCNGEGFLKGCIGLKTERSATVTNNPMIEKGFTFTVKKQYTRDF